MTRSRGKPPKTLVDRVFPHKVTLAASAARDTWEIAVFYTNVDIDWPDQHSRLLRKDDRDYYVYSFADPQHAQSFHALFGGELAIASLLASPS